MMKQKTRRRRSAPAIERAPNDAGAIGERIADLMLHPLDAAADSVKRVKQSRAERNGKRKARGPSGKRSRT